MRKLERASEDSDRLDFLNLKEAAKPPRLGNLIESKGRLKPVSKNNTRGVRAAVVDTRRLRCFLNAM